MYLYLRRKCEESFKIDDDSGQLYYRTSDRSGRGSQADHSQWKLCIKTVDEKEKLLLSCHAGPQGTCTLFGCIAAWWSM